MKALSDNLNIIIEKSYSAGCDVILHCNGDLLEMEEIASALPAMNKQSYDRVLRCEAMFLDGVSQPDSSSDRHELTKLLQS